ncbi:nitronate monooxygenase [bacterium]|nr:nitronate monooxygenase [bacterium]
MRTPLTDLLGCRYPIIAGPMFLVSDENLVQAVCKSGATAAMPSLNWRQPEQFQQAVRAVKKAIGGSPFGVNLIVNKANPRVDRDLEICAEEKVPFIITSLGNPKEVIRRMHSVGSKVFCDVTSLDYALKVADLGADGVIAVSSGAGGHAGPISPLVLIPYLKRNLKIPVIAAGGIATGDQIAAALVLGADGVQLGTRFIASSEAKVSDGYKNAILGAKPEDIVMTLKISGTPAAVIRTPYIDQVGTDISTLEKFLLKNAWTKKSMKMLRSVIGAKTLEKAASNTTWKEVWSAGQSAGLINEVMPAGKIVEDLMRECEESLNRAKSLI